ncbi:DNA polymerase III subunit delta [Legionella sp. D16C41]|uniref:DNA polymerase III subunit delta n=1 Tax=Legionella sp. D16C41 TaxID=3402688 RepID=UPI003AF6EE50
MFIKHSNLTVQLPKRLPALFFLIGQDAFQINQLTLIIKQAWHQQNNETEITTLFIESTSDWELLEQKANSYTLFATTHLIDVRYDKKSLEAAGKTFLLNYLANPNPACLLLFKTPNLPSKQLQFLLNHELAYVIQALTPSSLVIKKWLQERLSHFGLTDPNAATLVYQFNEGNLFACAQLLEKLELIHEPNQSLNLTDLKDHLHNQCNYSLFELADACLGGDAVKALQIIQHSYNNKVEATLILWLLAQEIRLLLQLNHLTLQKVPLQAAASQLKIWSSKINLYQSAAKRYNFNFLSQLLKTCKYLDMQLKTTQSKQVWQFIELIALSLCQGQLVGALG